MALGDGDISDGVFFSDFGDTINFGPQSTKGNIDAPAKDGVFGHLSVADVAYKAEVAAGAFNPCPKSKDVVTVATGRHAGAYAVVSVEPVEDGATIELHLRKQ